MSAYEIENKSLNETEVEVAATAHRMIISALDHSAARKIMLVPTGPEVKDCPQLELPPRALRFFAEILKYMSKGEEINIIPSSKEFSTQEAADFLNVSRPYVVKLIDEQKLKHTKVGSHRRVAFSDLLEYREQMMGQAKSAINSFSEEFNGED